jgi:hypothetical protein
MPLNVQPGETDLIFPLPPEGEQWGPYLIHTHYFGFCIPEHQIGGLTYIRYQPGFPLCGGGVEFYRGLDNAALTTVEHIDYGLTMPWPEVTDNGTKVTTANNLRFEFTTPGQQMRISYEAADGSAALRLDANAVTPLCARGHVMPDEELHTSQTPGGSEQFMHMTGTLRLGDTDYDVDCHYIRDRSWRQVREEGRNASTYPPISWTPMYFGDHLAFNQIGFEDPASNPVWAPDYELPDGVRTHNWGWLCRDGELLDITRVRRKVTRVHPVLLAPLAQEIEVTDERGDTYIVKGEAIGFAPIPGWHNLASLEALMRWEDETGAITHGPAQTFWGPKGGRAMLRASDFSLDRYGAG